MVLFDSTCINDDEEHAYFLQIQLIIYKARYPGSTSVSLPLKFNSWSKLKFHIALELVIIIAISPTHHQDVTLARGRHMTAPPPSNGTGHLAIRSPHQIILH